MSRSGDGPYSVCVARTAEDVTRLLPEWRRIPWEREEAEHEYFLARAETRDDVLAPVAIIVARDGEPAAALAARLESKRLETTFGQRVVYAPRLRVLQIVDGGIVAPDPAAIPVLVRALHSELAGGSADVAALPPLPLDSPLFAALISSAGVIDQQHLIAPWTRRVLALPGSFEEFLASRSGKIRFGIRYDTKKLLASFGEELTVAVLREGPDHERLVRELEAVARTTYQRKAGTGFADTPEQRALARVGLERGWLRAYVLYRSGEPIAFWLCATHRGVILLKTTGFDPAYLRERVGIYLLMRVIEDACADPSLHTLDFGPGDADYKRHFSSDARRERNLALFAPTFRARRVNALRTAILAGSRAGRWASDRAELTERLKAGRRKRLRG